VQTAQITDIRDVTLGGDQSSGIGSVAGAVLGGLAGGKVGSGTGRTITSIGGAIAGGVAGHRIESAMATRTVTELTIRFENGDVRTYNVEPGAAFRIGETVKITTNRGVTKITH
jgi:outer membrane lipoprotein SlyB